MILRDYQEHAVDALWEYFHTKKGNPLVLMPTGTGKSLVIGAFAKRALMTYPTTRLMMLTHVETLIEQNAHKLQAMWPTAPLGLHSAALGRRDTHQQIIYAGIQSVYKLAHLFAFVELLMVDEADLIGPEDASMYQTFFTALRLVNPRIKIIGFTATDWRTGAGRLKHGGVFTDVAIDMTTPAAWNWFVDHGYLAPLHGKKTNLRLDDTGIGKLGGEYILSQQQAKLDREEITGQAVHEMIERASDRHCWMLFGTGVNHCNHIAGILNELGVPAVAITSKSKDAAKLLLDYKHGKYMAAVSMNKLTTGVDVPQVDCIGVLRFTESSRLWVQMLGRGTRPLYEDGFDLSDTQGRLAAMQASAKPDGCLALDFAHNTERLGPINNPVVPEPKKKGKQRAGATPVRVCPQCAEYVHASLRFCPACKYEFTIVLHIQGHASTAEIMTRGEVQQPDLKVEMVDVQHVTYAISRRRGSDKPPTLRVSYYAVGLLRKFEEYVCFEHEGGMLLNARNWWRARSAQPVPETCKEAEALGNTLRIPKRIRVWVNIPKPRVLDYEYE
jgi:DNA repair protein RadD